VDVLSAPEPISDTSELDVSRYGVIVTSGHKRGLLLPNLDGVDTVDEQLNIAKQKAGIGNYEDIQLERFEVIRHES
jgi:AMMECR1 domain-containing protein